MPTFGKLWKTYGRQPKWNVYMYETVGGKKFRTHFSAIPTDTERIS